MGRFEQPLSGIRVGGGDFVRSLDLPTAVAAGAPEPVPPGMLTREERALLRETVRRTWRGEGAIVDGGSFLGSSLMAEAQGLLANPALDNHASDRFPAGKPIHGYELGVHPAPSNPEAPRRRRYGDIEYELGSSFAPLLEQNIAPHRDLIELHIGDLTEMHWDGSPIEVAFIDVCKTPELNAHVARSFYPALIEGGSTLIHQDFFYDRLPWIRVTMGYLADYVSWEGQVASSSVFRVVRRIPEDVSAYDPYTMGSLEECLTFHDAGTFPGIDRTAELMLALSRVHLMNQKGSQERALTELVQVAVDYVDILGPTSREATYRPTTGTAESMEPRYRMDLALTEVMRGAGPPAQPSARSAPTSRSPEILTASEALRRRDWDTARQVLRPLVDADSPGPARLLLARTELESGNLADAAAELDLLLSTRPKSARALALRARVHLEAGELDDARASAGLALQVASHSMVARRVMFDLEVAERLAQGHAERDSTGH
jgi:hypothetical protein